jgi:hypothetical protein
VIDGDHRRVSPRCLEQDLFHGRPC